MSNQFKTIGIIGKHGDPSVAETLQDLIQYLDNRHIEILLEDVLLELATGLENKVSNVDRNTLGQRAELVIVVGGDGTILAAARDLLEHEVPILGINLGRLGFLADISPAELTEKLDQIFNGEYNEEQRSMLHARVTRDGEQLGESSAFNDVVIHSCNVARMIQYETYINGNFVSLSNGDGLIVATPTGSTAYALSSGGPIVHPSLNALVLVTICPHTMSHRPIVIDANNQIEIVFSKQNQASAQVSCDGQMDISLEKGDSIHIELNPKSVRLIHPKNYNYYKILRAKLHWGKRLKPD